MATTSIAPIAGRRQQLIATCMSSRQYDFMYFVKKEDERVGQCVSIKFHLKTHALGRTGLLFVDVLINH